LLGSISNFNEKRVLTNQHDAGVAWDNLAFEAAFREIATHGIQKL
jgi:hypothetical protein